MAAATVTDMSSGMNILRSEYHSLVSKLRSIVDSMYVMERSFTAEQRIEHSQPMDDARIRFLKLYLHKFQQEKENTIEQEFEIVNEIKFIEQQQFSEYNTNRDQCLLNLHHTIRQLSVIDFQSFISHTTTNTHTNENEIIHVPPSMNINSYNANIEHSLEMKLHLALRDLNELQSKVKHEMDTSQLLRQQIQQQQRNNQNQSSSIMSPTIISNSNSQSMIHDISSLQNV
jgi:hypothetical protein